MTTRTQGNQLTVTTQNGAGTNHSAINWQTFSIPQGNSTYFQQPSSTSTVINRVVTNAPSQVFGTLGSNGHLVLINQSGITVGAGAVVDTAGFTASALKMSDADALAGRQRYGDGTVGGTVSVQGQVLARNGDVVLIGSNVDTGQGALIQAPNGSTVLAAGNQVEITGRGLEGISMTVQAPQNSAVNLGTLQGNAAAIFAGTLKHSGAIQATRATLEGGKVVLKAMGDAMVDGTATITATGTTGGSVDVLGQRVGLTDSASIDVSGTKGGGQVRIGGDYQGKNADVPNAQMTYVGQDVSIKANATEQGNGGRVIVWANDTTRAYGSIEAKGGASGGDGGFVETSGKRALDVNGIRVSASAAAGKSGSWLLDPADVSIIPGSGNMVGRTDSRGWWVFEPSSNLSTVQDSVIVQTLNGGTDVVITTFDTNLNPTAYNSFSGSPNGDITVGAGTNLNWASSAKLTLDAYRHIAINGDVSGVNGQLSLLAGNNANVTVGDVSNAGGGLVKVAKLEATAAGSVSLTGNNVIGTLAGKATGSYGGFTVETSNSAGLTVGNVGSTNGVTLAASYADLKLKNSGGAITISSDVRNQSAGAIELDASNGIAINAAVSSQQSVMPMGVVRLYAGAGGVSGTSAGVITARNLLVKASQSVDLSAANHALSDPTYNTSQDGAGTLAAEVSSGSFTFKNQNALAIGSVADPQGTCGFIDCTPTLYGVKASGDVNIKLASTNKAIFLNNQLVSGAGNIYVTADMLDGNLLNGTNTTEYLKTNSAGKFISFRHVDSARQYQLSSSALFDRTVTDLFKVGDSTDTGGVDVAGSVTVGSGVGALSLINGGDITQSNGALTITNLNLHSVNGNVYMNTTANSVSGNLAGYAGGHFKFLNAGSLVVGKVDVVNDGITVASGSKVLELTSSAGSVSQTSSAVVRSAGDLQITGATGVTLSGGNSVAGNIALASTNSAITYAQSGDIKLSTGAVSAGSGTVSLTSTKGAIVNTGTGSNVSAAAVDLVAVTGVGTSAAKVDVGATPLIKASTQTGGVYLKSSTSAADVQALVAQNGDIVFQNFGGFVTSGPVRALNGSLTMSAASPLTIGAVGVSATGNISLTASSSITLDGPIKSSLGGVSLSAGTTLTQNSSVYGAMGVSASAASMVYGAGATTSMSPVSYTAGGGSVAPPADPIALATTSGTLVTTFTDLLTAAVQEQALDSQVAQNDGDKDPLVPGTGGEICLR